MLHKIDTGEDRVTLIPTDRDRLRAHAFLDGRSDFSSGPAVEASLTRWQASLPATRTPDRYIFHVGFCGSTFLSRLLDVPGRALVLREPNCLAHLANLEQSDGALELVRRHLRVPWAEDEPVIVKPSNWANVLLQEMLESPDPTLVVFLHTSRDAFLRAVFRGGPQRIAFAARAAVHLSAVDEEDALLVARAIEGESDDQLRLARLALVLLDIEVRMFRRACIRASWSPERWLTHKDLASDPVDAALRMAAALEIELPHSEVESNVRRWRSRHAKSPADGFAPSDESARNAALWARHGEVLKAALDWAEANL